MNYHLIQHLTVKNVDYYGYDNSGNYVKENDKILRLAKEFTDLCIQISYARENIRNIIQQYSYIGTHKIISDIVREYFIKNFSKRADWRLISDRNLEKDKAENLLSIDVLNGNTVNNDNEKQFFNVNIIEYYDNTPYLNIYAELPSCIVGYTTSGTIVQEENIMTDEETVSTWMIKDNLISANFSPIYVITGNEEYREDIRWRNYIYY
jgi:tRNA(Glu) U13 pseudouridine synthase TruD